MNSTVVAEVSNIGSIVVYVVAVVFTIIAIFTIYKGIVMLPTSGSTGVVTIISGVLLILLAWVVVYLLKRFLL